jgi:hypothetical protein
LFTSYHQQTKMEIRRSANIIIINVSLILFSVVFSNNNILQRIQLCIASWVVRTYSRPNTPQKTTDWATRSPLKNGDEHIIGVLQKGVEQFLLHLNLDGILINCPNLTIINVGRSITYYFIVIIDYVVFSSYSGCLNDVCSVQV